MNSVTFRIDEPDYVAANRQAATANLLEWKGALILAVLVGMLSAWSGSLVEALPVVLIGSALWFWMMMRWMLPWQWSRIHRQQRDLHGEHRVTWTPEALHYDSPMGGTRTQWADFRRWRENKTVILLYRSDAIFLHPQAGPHAAAGSSPACSCRGRKGGGGIGRMRGHQGRFGLEPRTVR